MNNLLDSLNDEFIYDPNCPCKDCEHEGVCTMGKLACRDFETYVKSGEKVHENRHPTLRMYRRLFPNYA